MPATGGGCGAPPEAVQAPKWVDFPAAAQVIQVRRTRTIKGRKHVEVAYPGLLTAHGAGPARAGCRLGPRALGNREPAPRRSVTSSSMRTATSCAPATAPRSWPPCAPDHPASSAWSTAPKPLSPPPPNPCHGNQNAPSSSSPNQPPDPTLPTPCATHGTSALSCAISADWRAFLRSWSVACSFLYLANLLPAVWGTGHTTRRPRR